MKRVYLFIEGGQTYRRFEEIHNDCCFYDTVSYNKIIIKGNNSAPVILNQIKNVYLQDINVNTGKELVGDNVWAGKNVTNIIPKGEVMVKNGGSLNIIHTGKTILDNDFKVELGGKLSVKKKQ